MYYTLNLASMIFSIKYIFIYYVYVINVIWKVNPHCYLKVKPMDVNELFEDNIILLECDLNKIEYLKYESLHFEWIK